MGLETSSDDTNTTPKKAASSLRPKQRSQSPSIPPPQIGVRFGKMIKGYKEKYDLENKENSGVGRSNSSEDTKKSDTEEEAPRVALKKVQKSLSKERFVIGEKDLLVEAAILAECSHPNVISLYAVGCCDDNDVQYSSHTQILPLHRINFIMIDQLKFTLRRKISQWKAEKKGWFKSKKHRDLLWLERMMVVKKVADAIQYIHAKGFVHRDINPDNIGFCDDNEVKVFDFGLSKSIGRTGVNNHNEMTSDGGVLGGNDNETYQLTGKTGTLRYMSPEAALGKPYGFKTDIYSFSLVAYEVLNLTKCFSRIMEHSSFTKMVIEGLFRPVLNDNLPLTIQKLLKRMWSPDIPTRPSSKEIVQHLDSLISGEERHLLPKSKSWIKW